MEVLQGEMAFSMSPTQGLSTAKPRHHHAVCTIWVQPTISLCLAPPFLLTQRILPEVT